MCLTDAAHSYDLMNRPSVSVSLGFLFFKHERRSEIIKVAGESERALSLFLRYRAGRSFPPNGLIENMHFSDGERLTPRHESGLA